MFFTLSVSTLCMASGRLLAAGCALVCWLHQGLVEALVSYSSAGVSLGEYSPAKGCTVQCVSGAL